MKKNNLFGRLKAAATCAAVALTAFAVPAAGTQKQADAASDVNYAKALQYSLYLYDANMCGKEVGEKSRLDWRDDCHTYDSSVSTPYGVMDLSGGFHDCGDHVKFGITGAYAATMLGWSYYEFNDAFSKIGEADHLQTITDYFCDYFRRCTVMNGSSVQAFCYQVGDGQKDHDSWQSPEKDTMDRPVKFATSSDPCTDVVAETAAALAMNYINFKNPDDLTYAKALYSFAKSNNKANHTGSAPFYQGGSYLDDLAMASAVLYKATNDSSYKSDCAKWIADSNWAYTTRQPLCWDSVWPAVNALYGEEWSRVAENIDNNKSNTTSEGYFCLDDWGAARYNTALQMECLVYDKHNNSSSYTSWAKGQMEYLFGANKNNQCYMVGYADNSVKFPHHRAASGFTDFPSENKGKDFAHVLVGALTGGPNKNGEYRDVTDEYTLTEVGVDYNAALVGALAGLYLKYGAGQSPDPSVPGTSGTKPPVPTDAPTEAPTEAPTDDPIWSESQYEILIKSLPNTTAYNVGDKLDLTGLKVNLELYDQHGEHHIIYDNVSPLDNPDAFIVDTSEFDSSKAGTYTIKISCTDEYQSFLPTEPVSFKVEVTEITTKPPVTDIPQPTAPPATDVPSSGTNKIDVNKTVEVGSSLEIDISGLIPDGAEAEKIIINISSDAEIGTPAYGCDISMKEGYMQGLNNAVLNTSGNTGTIEYDIKDILDKIDTNGKIKVNYWWGNAPLKVESVTSVFKSNTPIEPTQAPTDSPDEPTDPPVEPTDPPTPTAPPVTENLPDGTRYGDVNLDGKINISDAVALSKYLIDPNANPLGKGDDASILEAKANADCQRDNLLDGLDTTLIVNYSAMLTSASELGKK